MRGLATLATIFHKLFLLLFFKLFKNEWQVWQASWDPRQITAAASHPWWQEAANMPGAVMNRSHPSQFPPDHTLEFGPGGGKVRQY